MAKGKTPGKSKSLAAELIHTALRILRDNGKEMPKRALIAEIEKEVDLSEWAKERYEKSGYIRWESVLHFYSINCVKAGYLVKKKGVWYLTQEGEEALHMDPIELLEKAAFAYRRWQAEQPAPSAGDQNNDAAVEDAAMAFEDVEQVAMSGLEKHVNNLNAYEFQDIVAALLRGMGYYTPFVAVRGKDGGIDVMAYRDPLGTQSPRIMVQIKHRKDNAATVQEVRQLMGLLQKEGDVGMFLSTGGFTSDAKVAARNSHVHVELIDLPRFIMLWQEFYHKLSDEDKSLMPLTPIFFLAKKE